MFEQTQEEHLQGQGEKKRERERPRDREEEEEEKLCVGPEFHTVMELKYTLIVPKLIIISIVYLSFKC